MTTTREFFDHQAAPMRIGTVRLKVRDLSQVTDFYQEVIGLRLLSESGRAVMLGTAERPFLELVGDPHLAPRDPRAAGLFHTAFLLPSRNDLAGWLRFISDRKVQLDGASDHGVSEAIYLADPEGNGIEVYADRPLANWTVAGDRIDIPTDRLDVESFLKSGLGQAWNGIPDGAIVGHIHLQVGDTKAAERFYGDVLGFDITCRYPGGSFFGAGGYHHQLAANIWKSRGAGIRPERSAGLESFEIVLRDEAMRRNIQVRLEETGIAPSANGDLVAPDPWGTKIKLVH